MVHCSRPPASYPHCVSALMPRLTWVWPETASRCPATRSLTRRWATTVCTGVLLRHLRHAERRREVQHHSKQHPRPSTTGRLLEGRKLVGADSACRMMGGTLCAGGLLNARLSGLPHNSLLSLACCQLPTGCLAPSCTVCPQPPNVHAPRNTRNDRRPLLSRRRAPRSCTV